MDARSKDARPSAEYSAKTVAEALKRAAEELHLPAEKLDYEVIKDSTRSVLGLVRTGEAIIRVWLPSPIASPVAASILTHEVTQAPMSQKPALEPEPLLPSQASPAAPALPLEAEEEGAVGVDMRGNPPELAQVASGVLATLLDKMDLMAAVEVAEPGGQLDPASGEVAPLVLNIIGDDLGALIGRRGETLRDLQFIARLIVSRQLHVWPNFVIDVEGYKAKRVNALRALAQRMASQVRKTRQMVVLEPMPAHERRVVHLALRDDPDVRTESTGVDEARKVQILPKRK